MAVPTHPQTSLIDIDVLERARGWSAETGNGLKEEISINLGGENMRVTCDHDRACGKGLFCDRHFGLCVALRHEGQFCRKDSQCVRGLGCMFGRCQQIIPGGREGSRCQQDEDCSPSMCCARHHGEMICKRKIPAGERCFIPEGGLAFSINQQCPCDEGLVCSSKTPLREKEFVYSHSSDWKCTAPSE
ncbi:dickkopf-related protein 3-like [Spea bombifrons]|uniref:dickkopf-related protein 3-like n=1 Tax=Spea bombifrons TaxID=233779 RepID=UPI00234ACD7E|nr:dickkopf-related protein 3-like [Spea bombifrons]